LATCLVGLSVPHLGIHLPEGVLSNGGPRGASPAIGPAGHALWPTRVGTRRGGWGG